MQIRSFDERNGFLTLHYQLSWPTSWEGMLSFLTVAGADVKASSQWPNIQVELSQRDITKEFRAADGDAYACPSAAREADAVRITGFSRALKLPVRITLWNQTDACTLVMPSPASLSGAAGAAPGSDFQIDPLVCDRYMDALEILSHRDRVRRQRSVA
ncbi:hypothetical protein [Schaalia sp. Marseille-Q2122]|uniref:hypothetical protein n=1 Tax=Schaalia sp. Marseille-Q2122 TaxID=2736604 RepID=UPI00158A2995|nr:hypothetical protein [Schaalia sp. Marseille-Q2122]